MRLNAYSYVGDDQLGFSKDEASTTPGVAQVM